MTDAGKRMALEMTLHNPPAHPHWSVATEWRPGRWDPMTNAPTGPRCLDIRGRSAEGILLEPMHFAEDLSGEDQPGFSGWFLPYPMTDGRSHSGYYQVRPIEWQPMSAQP